MRFAQTFPQCGAGMVSLLPTIDGRLFNIRGGNRLLPVALLERAGAKVYRHRVLHVNRTSKGTWLLGTDKAGSAESFKGKTSVASRSSEISAPAVTSRSDRMGPCLVSSHGFLCGLRAGGCRLYGCAGGRAP